MFVKHLGSAKTYANHLLDATSDTFEYLLWVLCQCNARFLSSEFLVFLRKLSIPTTHWYVKIASLCALTLLKSCPMNSGTPCTCAGFTENVSKDFDENYSLVYIGSSRPSLPLGAVAYVAVVRLLPLKLLWMRQWYTTCLLIISMTNYGHLRYGLLSWSLYVRTKSSNLK